MKKEDYRINLKLRGEFKQYLNDEAWKSRKSITEYINDLIQADMDAKTADEVQEIPMSVLKQLFDMSTWRTPAATK